MFITYTPDKENYTWWIRFPDFSKDKELTFQIIAAYIRAKNYDYQFFHVTFLSIYCFLYLFFISKFSKNVLIVTLLYIPCIFIFYGTQLRYFLGYYAILLALYFYVIAKNRLIAILFCVFAISSHYSLVLFIPVYFLLKIKTNFFIRILQYTLIVLVGYIILTTVIIKLLSGVRFSGYLTSEDLVSSYSGGIFTFAPLIPMYFLFGYYYKKRIKLNPSLINDSKFVFLYKMSLIPLVYIGIALTAQVIGHRIIMTGILFPILLFFYKYSEIRNTQFKLRSGIIFLVFYLFIFFHFNYSTGFFLGEWEGVEEMGKMIMSNEFLYDLLN